MSGTDEKLIQIGYLGSDCSFTCRAAKRFFHQYDYGTNGNYNFVPISSCKAIFHRVNSGDLTYGVVPIESSNQGIYLIFHSECCNVIIGSIAGTYDQLLKFSAHVRPIAETIEMEKYCLSMNSSASEDSLERVISHSKILENTSDYFDALDQKRAAQGLPAIERIPAIDSAAACKLIVSMSDSLGAAVVCCREAAELYNLKIIAPSIGNDQNSETRYIIVAKFSEGYTDPLRVGVNLNSPQRAENVKATIALSLKNIPSAMFRMTSCFALRDINVLKVETRPSSTAIGIDGIVASSARFQHWDLIFFVDYQPSDLESVNQALLRNLEEYCIWVRPLGVYRQYGYRLITAEPSEWSNMVDILATA